MIFLDTNIFADVLLWGRTEWKEASTEIIDSVRTKKEEGCISALTVPTLWYVTGEDREDVKKIKAAIKRFKMISLNSYIINLSFRSSMGDFEDAIQLNSALEAKADVLITRNKKDFEEHSGIAILTPEEFLERRKR